MRLRTALAAGAATAAIAPAVLAGPASANDAEPMPPEPAAPRSAGALPEPGGAPVDQQPACGDVLAPAFPVATRILAGPAEYRAGSAAGEFSIELTNTTAGACKNIHPVVVLAGRDQALTPDRIRMEYFDQSPGIWRPVTFEWTDQGEAVGALGAEPGGFAGFALPARGTVTVRVRLAFPAGAVADSVVANAAVVQRRGADGDWVGESNDYRFSLLAAEPTGSGDAAERQPGKEPGTYGTATPRAHELAATGTAYRYAIGLASAVGALLVGAVALRAGARRLRSGRH
ncbi:hypothetical protein ACWGI8_02750 [Streptomyces sp. NPDC054841]